jgi:hypothetical protein
MIPDYETFFRRYGRRVNISGSDEGNKCANVWVAGNEAEVEDMIALVGGGTWVSPSKKKLWWSADVCRHDREEVLKLMRELMQRYTKAGFYGAYKLFRPGRYKWQRVLDDNN